MSEHNPNEGIVSGSIKKTNPWMVIGWIVLAMIVIPIGSCVAITAIVIGKNQQEGYEQKSAEAKAQAELEQQEAENQETN